MDFLTAKNYVDSLNKFGSVLGLDNIFKLLEKLNNPQDKLNVIHVAGTNGKGSTITYIESILCTANYTTGKYTSPVVFDYLEKYQINGKNISESEFVDAFVRVKYAYEQCVNEGSTPTIFEFETAMAFVIFEIAGVDVAIIETGMGGDTDATNVFAKVLLSVITSISMDHMAFLGNTIEEIASHKAGIIVKDCPVVANALDERVLEVIKQNAVLNNSKVYESYAANACGTDDEMGIIEQYDYYSTNHNKKFDNITTKMIGSYQRENIALAIESILALNNEYSLMFNITDKEIAVGIENAKLKGRFEKINMCPDIYIDGAHNPDAVYKLKETILKLKSKKKYNKIIFVMGVLADKDYEKECELIAAEADNIYTVTPNNARGLDGKELKDTISKYNEKVEFIDDISKLKDIIYSESNKNNELLDCKDDNLVVAFGSLSYLSDFRKIIKVD